MKKRKLLLLAGPLILLIFLFIAAAKRQAVMKHRDAVQQNVLNQHFVTIKPVKERILMKAKNIFFPSFDWHQTRILPVGAEFTHSDRHWHANYTITGTTSDGVIIAYNYSSEPGQWSGTLIVPWQDE